MLNRYLLAFLVFASALGSLSLPGCKPREEQLQDSGGLAFSADTVKFDTVFTTLRTVTKRLWVYNRNPKAVNIDLISLDNPNTSPYTLLINGDLKQTATNLLVRGQDSLLILVRAQLKDNGLNGAAKAYVQEDKLNFSTNGQQQHVLLRSFGQNIYLHQNVQLACGTTWTNDRPHVLYGTVLVPARCTLRIKPGTRIFAHAGAALVVEGTLLVNAPTDFTPGTGTTDTISAKNANLVRFTGDRSGETQYATAPGQWTGIVLDAPSRNNLLRYALVQNSTFGVLLYNPKNDQTTQPDLTIQNSVLRYISGAGVSFAAGQSNTGLPGAAVLSLSGRVAATNTLFSDCYEYAVLGYGGGSFDLNFCTIANFPATGAVRKTASLTFTDASAADTTLRYPLAVSVRNSVVWGSIDDELFFQHYDAYKANVSVRNSALKTTLYNLAADAPNKPGLNAGVLNNLVNQDPKFVKPYGGILADYHLGSTSPARLRGPAVGTPNPVRDLLNLPRDAAKTSLGAYESTK